MNTFVLLGAAGLLAPILVGVLWMVYMVDGWKAVLVTSMLYLWCALCMYWIHLGLIVP